MAAPLRIMPLGDSITMGYGVGGGYRTKLYRNLDRGGYAFSFVGLSQENPSPTLTAADQVFHNGYGGFKVNEISANLISDANWLSADPDIILLLIGTNDYSQDNDTPNAINRLDTLITVITSNRPNASLIVANLLPRTDDPLIETRIQAEFNALIPGLVTNHAALGERVYFLDLHAALDPLDLIDGTHPTTAGYNKMGNAWFQAIQNVVTPNATTNVIVAVTTTPLVNLSFNEASGSTLVNPGTAGGNFTLTSDTPTWTSNAPPQVGQGSALDFGFTQGDFAVDSDAPLPALGGLNQFTITAWINTRSPVQGPGGNRLVSWMDNGGDGVDLVYLGDGAIDIGINREADSSAKSTPGKIPEGFDTIPANWRFIAVTYDATTGEVRHHFGTAEEDATLDVIRDYTQGPVGTAIGRMSVGHSNPATRPSVLKRVFRGLIDNVQIHDHVLGLAEIVGVQRATGGVTNPPSGSPMRTLTVTSVNPASGVVITVSPINNSDQGSGSTQFTRTYSNNVPVTLTAPTTAGVNTFAKWQKNGVELSTNPAVTVTMDANHTLTAHFTTAPVGGASGALVNLSFNEASGSTLVNPGTAGGNFTLTSDTPTWTSNAPPQVGQGSALDFGFTQGDFAVDSDAPLPALGGLNQFTITAWINTRSPVQGPGGNRLVSWMNNGGDGVDLVYLGDGAIDIGINREADSSAKSTPGKIPEGFDTIPANWRFIAVTYDATTGEVRHHFGTAEEDATLDVIRDYTQGPVGTAIGRMSVGHSNPATRPSVLKRVFRGLIDNVQIHDHVLGLAEIVGVQRATGGVTNPPSGSPMRTLTVTSVNPASGVAITVSPTDNNEQGSGSTQFTRTYSNNVPVTLTAPTTAGVNKFAKWQKNGVDLSTNPAVTVTMDANHTLTAHFATALVAGASGALVNLSFNEASGSTLVNPGTAGGNFTLTSDTPTWTSNAPPQVGQGSALDFGFTQGDFAVDSDAPLPALGGLNQFTITAWINTRSPVQGPGGNRLVSWMDNGGDGVDLVYLGDGAIDIGINREADTSAKSTPGKIPEGFDTIPANWRFIAVTYDATTGEVRHHFGTAEEDATLDVIRDYAQGPVGTSIGRMSVGHSNPATRLPVLKRVFRGLIDNVQIHDHVLSLPEIVNVQRSGVVGGTNGVPPRSDPPRIISITRLNDGRMRLNLSGEPGKRYSILAGTDLANWSALADSVANADGSFEFIDSQASEFPMRFYSAVQR